MVCAGLVLLFLQQLVGFDLLDKDGLGCFAVGQAGAVLWVT
jgi:hypothetical protein